jgi:hypothetical protein
MLTFHYEDARFFDDAWEAVKRREAFTIEVRGLRAWLIKKARPLAVLLIENPSRPNWLRLLKPFIYAFPTPFFWTVYIAAFGAGMRARWQEHDTGIAVSFQVSA